MGLFHNLFSKHKKNVQNKKSAIHLSEMGTSFEGIMKEQAISMNDSEKGGKKEHVGNSAYEAKFITENCEQILEINRQLEEVKREYQGVTSYLNDIQIIDRIPPEDRVDLDDIATRILNLNREREKYHNRTRSINDVQFKHIAKFQEVIKSDLKRMNEHERYKQDIESDLKHLEGEKGWINGQMKETILQQESLKRIATVTSVIVLILFAAFVILGNVTKASMDLPFFMTIIMAIIVTCYVATNALNNRKSMKVYELRMNKTIGLLNKTKIKSVNNTNSLEYSYQKYMVNSYTELYYLWEEYKKAKEEEKIYRKNSEVLEYYQKELIADLKNFGIVDAELWIYQVIALIDPKEMVEVRHRLNARRQKLRDLIEYNGSTRDKYITEIKEFLDDKPQNKENVIETLKKFGIYL